MGTFLKRTRMLSEIYLWSWRKEFKMSRKVMIPRLPTSEMPATRIWLELIMALLVIKENPEHFSMPPQPARPMQTTTWAPSTSDRPTKQPRRLAMKTSTPMQPSRSKDLTQWGLSMQFLPARAHNIQHRTLNHILMVIQTNHKDLIIVKANETGIIIEFYLENHNSSLK